MGSGMAFWRAAAARRGLTIRDLEPAIGVEVGGVDLAAPEDAEITAILRGACVERTLLLIRGQQHLTPDEYVAFTRRFGGALDIHSRQDLCVPGHPEIFVVGNVVENGRPAGAAKVGLNWHTDHYHLECPALFTFLHALEVPPVAGETRYANGIAAWEALDEPLRARIAGLRVRHSRRTLFRILFPDSTEAQVEAEGIRYPDVVHPLVRTHPESGRRGLYLGGEWGSIIDGLPAAEAASLFATLLAHMTRPDFVHEHHWRPGDLLMSDNRCSLHRATEWDEGLHKRRLHRIILLDEARPSA
jgi:taurine dioxygenase